MTTTAFPSRTPGPVCPTDHTAFTDYGVFDGTDLVRRVRYHSFEAGYGHYAPTPEFFEAVGRAFRTAFVRGATVPVVPEPVDLAVEDAVSLTGERYEGVPNADVEEVLWTFYRTVAELYCAYRGDYPDGGAGIWFDESRF